jgi:hypothetical protein
MCQRDRSRASLASLFAIVGPYPSAFRLRRAKVTLLPWLLPWNAAAKPISSREGYEVEEVEDTPFSLPLGNPRSSLHFSPDIR